MRRAIVEVCLLDLPYELLDDILWRVCNLDDAHEKTSVDYRTTAALQRVCRTFFKILSRGRMWRRLSLQQYPSLMDSAYVDSFDDFVTLPLRRSMNVEFILGEKGYGWEARADLSYALRRCGVEVKRCKTGLKYKINTHN